MPNWSNAYDHNINKPLGVRTVRNPFTTAPSSKARKEGCYVGEEGVITNGERSLLLSNVGCQNEWSSKEASAAPRRWNNDGLFHCFYHSSANRRSWRADRRRRQTVAERPRNLTLPFPSVSPFLRWHPFCFSFVFPSRFRRPFLIWWIRELCTP